MPLYPALCMGFITLRHTGCTQGNFADVETTTGGPIASLVYNSVTVWATLVTGLPEVGITEDAARHLR